MHPRTIEYDRLHHEWRCILDEHTTLVAATREKLEEDLAWIDRKEWKKRRLSEDGIRSDKMLCLSRRPGEAIRIGEDVTVYVSRVVGNCVRLSIEAPDTVRIVRTELLGDQEDRARPRTV